MSDARVVDAHGDAGWQARLQPWLDALSEAGLRIEQLSRAPVSDMENLWVVFNATDNSDHAWLLRLEAMELLKLLTRVDRRLAWRLLAKASRVGDSWVKTRYEELHVLPRFQLVSRIVLSLRVTRTPRSSKRLLDMKMPPTSHSASYDDVKTTLLDQLSKTHRELAFDREKAGRVEVSLAFDLPVVIGDMPSFQKPASGGIEAALMKIEQVVQAHRERDGVDNTSRIPRAVEHRSGPLSLCSLNFSSGSEPVPDILLTSISRMASMGVPTTCFDLQKVDTTQVDDDTWRGFLKNQVSSLEGSGIQKLSFDMSKVDIGGMEALFLAIVTSRSLREVDCGSWSRHDEALGDHYLERWLWLAYALFSNEATHDIHTVSLNMDAYDTIEYDEAMLAVFSHDDLLACIYEFIRTDEADGSNVRSTAATAVLRPSAIVNRGRYDSGDQAHQRVAIESGTAYRVVRNRPQDDCIEIAVPGYGICWSQRSEILEMSPVAKRENHSVRHLNLHNVGVGGDHFPTILQVNFIKLVGGPIEWLTLYNLQLTDHHFFAAILSYLPNLKRLDLVSCRVNSVAPLSALRFTNATRLESLHFHDVGLKSDEDADWKELNESCEDLMAALSDLTNPMALSLRELHVDFKRGSNRDLNLDTLESVVEMLKKNDQLHRCEVVLREISLSADWVPRFLAHDGPLPGKLGPLPQAETLAFLSAVTATSSNASSLKKIKGISIGPSARYKVNAESLRLILDWAALSPHRKCIKF